MKQKSKNKKFKKGFTLIELLVVVLIISILAAIALPQYKMAVAKTKYVNLKTIARDLSLAAERHYMVRNSVNLTKEDLDIDYNFDRADEGGTWCNLYFKDGSNCIVSVEQVICSTNIFGVKISYYKIKEGKDSCLVYSKDGNDVLNKLCKQETESTNPTGESHYNNYVYPF